MTCLKRGVYRIGELQYIFLRSYLNQRDKYPAERLPIPEYYVGGDECNRVDFAFPFFKVAVEFRDTTWANQSADCRLSVFDAELKCNKLQSSGWSVLVLNDETVVRGASGLPDLLDGYPFKYKTTAKSSIYSCLYFWLYQERVVYPYWRLALDVIRDGTAILMTTRWSLRIERAQVIEEITLPGERVDFIMPSQRASRVAFKRVKELWSESESVSVRE